MAQYTICDICGAEINHKNTDAHLLNKPSLTSVPPKKGFVKVSVLFEPTPHGDIKDICGSCRYFLLDMLDLREDDKRASDREDARATPQKPTPPAPPPGRAIGPAQTFTKAQLAELAAIQAKLISDTN